MMDEVIVPRNSTSECCGMEPTSQRGVSSAHLTCITCCVDKVIVIEEFVVIYILNQK
jgi:hypothetical protein